MGNDQTGSRGIFGDITEHLGGIFRHMFPGVLVVGCANLAYPDLFPRADLNSWQHLIVLAVITTTIGNTWFALNRYGLHQVVDYFLYLIKSKGPARNQSYLYLDDLGKYTFKSLTLESHPRARQHVAFRASTVLLALTLGELLLLSAVFHSDKSIFAGKWLPMCIVGGLALAVGIWQMVITRRIDYYVVNPP